MSLLRSLGLSLLVVALFPPAAPAAPYASYFPLVPGAVWVRKADDGGEIRATVTRQKFAGSVRCTIIETKTVRDGRERVTRICYQATATYVRAIETEFAGRFIIVDPPRTVLLLPPQAGKTWSWTPKDAQVPATITEEWMREESVKVAAGTFKAWEVRTVTKRADTTVTLFTWYAPGVGIVKIEREEQRGQLQREGGSELVSYKIP
ncbi:MAG TPA: hypothetical protein VFT63_05635 [bacterium]|nr:hypothetical protein [bacterium]